MTRMHTADPSIACPHLAFQPDQLTDVPFLPMGEVETSYYLRMRVDDKPGVLADITRILADRDISIDAMIQKEPPEGEDQTDIILLTHRSIEKRVVDAIRTDRGAADGARKGRADPVRSSSIDGIGKSGVSSLMRYISTRGAWTGDPQPFCAILLGRARPRRWIGGARALSAIFLRRIRGAPSAAVIASLRLPCCRASSPTFRRAELRRMIDTTYSREIFGSDDVTPLLPLEPGLSLLRVSNGPTARVQGHRAATPRQRCSSTCWPRENRTSNIVGATSGDTGPSAEYAMRGQERRQCVHVVAARPDEPVPAGADVRAHGSEHLTTLRSKGRSTIARRS